MSADRPMRLIVSEEDRQWASDLLMREYHDQFCEYDSTEDGVDLCGAECGEFATLLTGVEPTMDGQS